MRIRARSCSGMRSGSFFPQRDRHSRTSGSIPVASHLAMPHRSEPPNLASPTCIWKGGDQYLPLVPFILSSSAVGLKRCWLLIEPPPPTAGRSTGEGHALSNSRGAEAVERHHQEVWRGAVAPVDRVDRLHRRHALSSDTILDRLVEAVTVKLPQHFPLCARKSS